MHPATYLHLCFAPLKITGWCPCPGGKQMGRSLTWQGPFPLTVIPPLVIQAPPPVICKDCIVVRFTMFLSTHWPMAVRAWRVAYHKCRQVWLKVLLYQWNCVAFWDQRTCQMHTCEMKHIWENLKSTYFCKYYISSPFFLSSMPPSKRIRPSAVHTGVRAGELEPNGERRPVPSGPGKKLG